MGFFRKLFDTGYKEYKRCYKIALKVDSLQDEYKKKTDEELKNKTVELKKRYQNGESLDSLLVEAYANVREASTRVLKMTPFFVQIVGAIVLHGGNVAEMKTGEGKTLTSVMPAYLNALTGDGVHIVTVNEYLVGREANGEIGNLFRWLGLTVGENLRELDSDQKRAAYNCDILYSTNNELGFDYLRDHMALYKEQMVQRKLNYAIVDEVDSILIDEARTPLIISGGAKNTANLYGQADMFAKRLKEDDYDIDLKLKHIALTETGMQKAEVFFNVDNLYDLTNVNLLHHINNALRANYIMERDVDYVVHEGAVVIVDAFTGRLMFGRQYSEGLHQALEAKEHVEVQKETQTVATITFQNFFRMYKKLSGMTGTAKTEEEEFRQIYNMYVVVIPTNKPVIRVDANDMLYGTAHGKYEAIANDIAERHRKGQPVLIGTISIETSEHLSSLLKKRGIKHEVLNAKQHEREAEIVAHAGEKFAVTIATNMAGRGTDIKLGEGVVELGGLAVIGTERHEARRIDNQLRGRSGRQGDPGYTRFYLSVEDDLIKRFGSESFIRLVQNITGASKGNEEEPIEFRVFSRLVESAQRKVEASNYDARKGVLQYDEVLRIQREIIYKERDQVLFLEDIKPVVYSMFKDTISDLLVKVSHPLKGEEETYQEKVYKTLNGIYYPLNYLNKEAFLSLPENKLEDFLYDKALELITEKEKQFGQEMIQEFLKVILLRVVDEYWMEHIDAMSELRQAVQLQSYAQVDPLREYQEIGFEKFQTMINSINEDIFKYINRAQIRENLEREAVVKDPVASSGEAPVKKKPVVRKEEKVGRNSPCPCGSGKKYKNCCGQ